MRLSKSSWHYKLHTLLYGEYAEDPKNFCPYFWKTIILGTILIVPMTIMSLPLMLVSRIISSDPIKVKDEGYISEYLFVALMTDVALAFGYCMIAMWFYPFKEGHFTLKIGAMGYFIAICVLIAWAQHSWVEARRRRRYNMMIQRHRDVPDTERRPNVFLAYVKAWYKKNCPIIDWK